MKHVGKKIISGITAWLLLGSLSPAYAVEWDNKATTQGTTEQKKYTNSMSQKEFIQSLQPKNTGQVTIWSDTKKKKKKTVVKRTLKADKKEYSIPSWMLDERCESVNLYYAMYSNSSSLKKQKGIRCDVDISYSKKLNHFSEHFFKEYLESEETVKTEEETVKTEEETVKTEPPVVKTEVPVVVVEEVKEEDISVMGDILKAIEGLDESTQKKSEKWEIVEEKSDELKEKKQEDVKEKKVTVLKRVGKKKVLELSDATHYYSDVNEVLQVVAGEQEMTVLEWKKKEEPQEEKVVEESKQEKKVVEKKVKVFPKADVSRNTSLFMKMLFLSDVKDILFSVEIDQKEVALSSAYLALALDSFTKKMEIIQRKNYKILGLKKSKYYNNMIQALFLEFSKDIETQDWLKILAQDISNITFSFSNYTDIHLNNTIKKAFKKKLIADIQKLESDYVDLIKEQNKAKEAEKKKLVKSFFSKRMDKEKAQWEKKREKLLKERAEKRKKEFLQKQLLGKKQEERSIQEFIDADNRPNIDQGHSIGEFIDADAPYKKIQEEKKPKEVKRTEWKDFDFFETIMQ